MQLIRDKKQVKMAVQFSSFYNLQKKLNFLQIFKYYTFSIALFSLNFFETRSYPETQTVK